MTTDDIMGIYSWIIRKIKELKLITNKIDSFLKIGVSNLGHHPLRNSWLISLCRLVQVDHLI